MTTGSEAEMSGQVHKRDARSHFDAWSKRYDSGHLTSWFRDLQVRLISTVSPASTDWVLDVGCGTGFAVRGLGGLLASGRACGIDLAPGMIAQAKSQANGHVDNTFFAVADAENIPYRDRRFDAVISSSSFHHYPDPVGALREFRRILKPGGRAFVLDTYRDRSLLIALYDLGHRLVGSGHVRYYSRGELEGFFKQAGFTRVRGEFSLRRFFHRGKFLTSVVLVSGTNPAG